MSPLYIISLACGAAMLIVAIGLRTARLVRNMRLQRPEIDEVQGFPRMVELVGAHVLTFTVTVPTLVEIWSRVEGGFRWIVSVLGLSGLIILIDLVRAACSTKRTPAIYNVAGIKSKHLKAVLEDVLRELGITYVEERGSYQVSWPSTLLSGNPIVDPATVGKCPFVKHRSMVAFHVSRTGWGGNTTIATGGSAEITNAVVEAMRKRFAAERFVVGNPNGSDAGLSSGLTPGVAGASTRGSEGE